jgi:hypothetical protein
VRSKLIWLTKRLLHCTPGRERLRDDPAPATYVRMKGNACKRVGMESLKVILPHTATTDELLREIDTLIAQSVEAAEKSVGLCA